MPKDEAFFNMDEGELINVFFEIFYHELESWFSADIACCDNCYDELLRKWPAIYTRDSEFQRSCIELKCFYDSTHLQDVFTVEEFNKYVHVIKCPRCGNPLGNHMWPYDLKFDLPNDFENILVEINDMAKRTPFVILSHPFCQSTYEEIKKLGRESNPALMVKNYYRARKLEKEKNYLDVDFKYPPRTEIKEGRYNHAGYPVIYLADSETTCFYELRKPREGVAIAEVEIKKPLKILDLFQIGDEWDNILNAAAWSSLMSSPEEGTGWYKPHYVFTRFIADCSISAGFDGIKYPSVRLGERSNIVLLNGVEVWKDIEVKRVSTMSNEECNEKIQRLLFNTFY